MSFVIPNAVNYRSPLNAVPLDWTSFPVEGAKGIQCTVAWGTDAGANKSVYVNCQNNATLNFSKIRALIVDNSGSGADIQFIFPDTETTVSVPSYTPYAIIPVFTNQTQFYVVAPNAQIEDVTNFTILNTAPPPIAVPTTQEQNFVASLTGINAVATGNQQLVPAGINGTIEAVSFAVAIVAAATSSATLSLALQDGGGNTFLGSVATAAQTQSINAKLFELSDLRLRFQNGLKLVWQTQASPAPTLCYLFPNIYYRTP